MVLNYQVVQDKVGVSLLQEIQRKQRQHIPNKFLCCEKYQSRKRKRLGKEPVKTKKNKRHPI